MGTDVHSAGCDQRLLTSNLGVWRGVSEAGHIHQCHLLFLALMRDLSNGFDKFQFSVSV